MKLRDIVSDITIDSRKLTEYVLDPDNPKGADKAIMFERHLGFTRDNYQLLLDKIKATVLDAEEVLQQTDIYGRRYRVNLEIMGVHLGQKEIVRTAWIIEPNKNIA